MRLPTVVLAAAMSIGMIGAANAATYKVDDLGPLGDGAFGYVANGFGSAGSFDDVINFSLTNRSSLSGLFAVFGLDASYALDFGASTLASGAFTTGEYSFADLAPGNYRLSIFGTNSTFGSYVGTYSVAAVPEAETWLMILIGMGLVAFQLQRKQRSLHQQSLSPA
jgi:hypothetical protein